MVASRRERSVETEQALKDAARRVFAERGYLNTKITDITTAAGRAAGSFYNHFASKEELLQSLLADLAEAGDAQAEQPEHNPDFSDPDAVRFHIAAYWKFAREHAVVLRAMGQAAIVNEEFARKLGRFGVEQRADVADHLDGLAAKGLQLPSGVDASLAMVFYLTQGILGGVEDGTLELSDDEAIEGLTRFIYRGLTGRDY
ncbi:TetR/AcrR family transcriptional regulator [Nocardia cyriacigeorgica]|uniref:TetR/AcrR family transcriptional regulator n=2 Tax=Nocardia cyriacigeorgica TaxID=135487 RepID=A0A2L2JTS0_9NOCA|nr:TetR/AcrR family transcriptional regulator [Nocardia cyriacigeorgica]CCF64202.1 putative transcriptional regulator,TetR family protein [Nocardia cyriacigeorgica GUH-2]MBF6322776.1 TetR/AcrR family transcriptional regulator [Nocardia cyriacigeorgica]MBF6423459.1 TetR/AcrR family transcriptional regulator [Nocardia cyriacigeorgica]NEW32664.1 TetR/AcrR family transcriptional regulator [Nocardia cyriacigeorgica]